MTDPSLLTSTEKRTLYCGFDPTSDSLHVGSLLPLLTLRRFQQAGHTVIPVVGGATGMIGDPSGKSQERSLLDEAQLQKNVQGIARVVARFLPAATVANNGDWFRGFNYIEFLRDIGKHFTVNYMVAKESVRARLEDRDHGISYTEFSYMLLQAYDFYYLHKEKKCTLQIGGSDQWGNITAGVELIRRMTADRNVSHAPAERVPEVFGMTHPLVMKADGTKFGKTEAGTVWLDPARTSPYEFYQFFIQTADADAITYLKYFTFRSIKEIDELADAMKRAPEKREAQTALARDLTILVHGEAELAKVEGATQALFGGKSAETNLRDLSEKDLLAALSGAPQKSLDRALIAAGYPLVDALVASELCGSKGAARKDVAGGGINVNNERVSDATLTLQSSHLIAGKYVVLRKGKKNYFLLVFA